MRNNLHRRAQVVASALLGDDALVDTAGRVVTVAPTSRSANKALVVPQIEIGFRAVVRNEHLAVLKRAHRARVDIDVGIELDHADRQSARFQNCAEAG